MFLKRGEEKKEILPQEENSSKRKIFVKKAGVIVVLYFDAIVAVVVLLVFVISFFFFINPKYKAINEKETYSLEDLTEGRANLENYRAKLVEYRDLYHNLSDVSRERIEKVVPMNEQLENFFIQIENITKRQGVLISSLSILDVSKTKQVKRGSETVSNGDEETGEDLSAGGGINVSETITSDEKDGKDLFGEAEITLTVSGIDYFGVKKLLAVFENNLRLMDVKSVSFDTTSKNADFIIVAYFIK